MHVVALSIRLFGRMQENADAERGCEKSSAVGQSQQEDPMSFAALMVHVDLEHESAQRVELAIGLADRFQAALIGVAGYALWPAFMAGDVGLTESNQYDLQKATARFDERGKTFRAHGRSLKQIEWRSALEPPGELLLREARAADLLIVGRRHSDNDAEPGVIVLRAGRPVLLVPDTIGALPLRRVVVAWKDTRECRRAVRDALPFLQQAKEVLLVEIGENESGSQAKKNLADVAAYLVRHRVIVAAEVWRRPRGPAAAELLHVVKGEKESWPAAMGTADWVNGFSAASRASFCRQAPFAACCPIDLRVMSDCGYPPTVGWPPRLRASQRQDLPCACRHRRAAGSEPPPGYAPRLRGRFNGHDLQGMGFTLMTAD